MKSFKQFLKESPIETVSGFLISRQSMPQIQKVDQFDEYLESKSIEADYNMVNYQLVNTIQIDYDEEKVDRIYKKLIEDPSLTKPLIVSYSDEGYYTLDGHHRLLAFRKYVDNSLHPFEEVHVYAVSGTINQVMKLAYEYKELFPDG